MAETFGKYRLLERLAEGGMAEVFKALVSDARGRDRVVAIKRLHRALSEDMDLVQMLIDEAAVAVQLNHPNIGEVFDLGQIDERYFLIMEFIEGVDLQRILDELGRQRRRMPLPLVVAVMAEVCSGLHYAHSKNGSDGEPLGIVHRDVSPQNIMLSVRGEVKLVDFGIAKTRMRAQQTQAGIIKGKYYYMAPEQAHGHHVDPRTDVFATGMVLYQLVAGRSAYEDVPERGLMRAVRMCEFPSLGSVRPDLDPELAQIIERAVERSPELRWSNAMELQLALNDYHQRKLPRISRHDLVQFIADTTGVRGADHGSTGGDQTAAMARQVYRASEESMLFECPESLVHALDSAELELVAASDDLDEPPTALYNPEELSAAPIPVGPAPEPAARHLEPTQTEGVHPQKRPLVLYGAIVAIAALVAAAGASFVLGETSSNAPVVEAQAPVAEPAVAAPAPAPTVALALETTPPEATVAVDGEIRGSTPLSLRLEVGRSYEIELRKPGYQPLVEKVVADEADMQRTVALQRAAGILKVASFPPDAIISIDGKEVGETPVTQIGLAMELPHEVSATLDGQTLQKTVRWDDEAEGNIREVMFEFQKVEPAQAAVELGGGESGESPDSGKEAAAQETARRAPEPKPAPKKRTSRKRRRPKPKPEPAEPEGLDLWGSESKGSGKAKESSADEELDVW